MYGADHKPQHTQATLDDTYTDMCEAPPHKSIKHIFIYESENANAEESSYCVSLIFSFLPTVLEEGSSVVVCEYPVPSALTKLLPVLTYVRTEIPGIYILAIR